MNNPFEDVASTRLVSIRLNLQLTVRFEGLEDVLHFLFICKIEFHQAFSGLRV